MNVYQLLKCNKLWLQVICVLSWPVVWKVHLLFWGEVQGVSLAWYGSTTVTSFSPPPSITKYHPGFRIRDHSSIETSTLLWFLFKFLECMCFLPKPGWGALEKLVGFIPPNNQMIAEQWFSVLKEKNKTFRGFTERSRGFWDDVHQTFINEHYCPLNLLILSVTSWDVSSFMFFLTVQAWVYIGSSTWLACFERFGEQ